MLVGRCVSEPKGGGSVIQTAWADGSVFLTFMINSRPLLVYQVVVFQGGVFNDRVGKYGAGKQWRWLSDSCGWFGASAVDLLPD